jgi:3-deoxy-D-manno-octulosonate 8-phosphate phosphatase (KDO 8-P phosphatase)
MDIAPLTTHPSPLTGEKVTLMQRCALIDLLVLDVDGVLTDGGIIYTDDGVELKKFHVRDGSALMIWKHAGKRSAIISGRKTKAVEVRAAELGISPVFQGETEKLPCLRQTLAATRLKPEQVCCIGDDLPDLPLLRNCGLAVAVADACPEVLAEAHFVTRTRGGKGAVREVVELILSCQGLWPKVVEHFRNQLLPES